MSDAQRTSNLDDAYPPNVPGAVIFLLYILAALVLSGQAVFRICQQYNAQKRTSTDKRTFAILSLMTLLSFSTLSYNMLSFLILSYQEYAKVHSWTTHNLQDLRLWEWMSHSTLFQDFANAIVNRPEIWWWTQLALIVSFEICLWIPQKFRHDGISGLQNLFLISQILPISFTLNLAHLTILTKPTSKPNGQGNVRASAAAGDAPPPELSMQLFASGAYLACLYAAPQFAGQPMFIPLVGLVRMLLYSPYYLRDGQQKDSSPLFIAVLGFGLLFEHSKKLLADGVSPSALWEVILDHPAVRAIGQDVVLSAISVAVYFCV